jgi:cytochrome oxidase assembly protein ShyY1
MDLFPPRSQVLRLIWIDAAADEAVLLNRGWIANILRVSIQQASLDLSLFRRLFPGRLIYDGRRKGYLAVPGTAPVFGDWQRRAVTEAVNAMELAEDAIELALQRAEAA